MQNDSDRLSEVFFALCKTCDTPFSLGQWLRWKYRVTEKPDMPRPWLYDSAYTFGLDYLTYTYASKAEVEWEGIDPDAAALVGFAADEEFNKQTSERLEYGMLRGFSPRDEDLIFRVRRKIAAVLGPYPGASRVLDSCRWGNGASNTLSRAKARFDKKIATFPFTVSPAAYGFAEAVVRSDPHWLLAIRRGTSSVPGFPLEFLGVGPELPSRSFSRICEFTDFATFDMVPKTRWTRRTIAKEPVLNGFLQQGVHVYLRKRLKRFGVDLRNQGLNQNLASIAHLLGLATIDLKSASNSVTRVLLKLLLPIQWFNLLDALRSRRTLMPNGEYVKTYCFSSMGNAFTFELETLVFYAVLSALSHDSKRISAYGDDLICPQSCAGEVIYTLNLLGFRVNTDKTFVGGRFFESCGKHYFDGHDVTPVYQKSSQLADEHELIRAHNRLWRWDNRQAIPHELSVTEGARKLLRRLSSLGLYGPEVEGDPWLFSTREQLPGFDRNGHMRLRALVPVQARRRTSQAAAYSYALRIAGCDRSELQSILGDDELSSLSEVSGQVGWVVRKVRLFQSQVCEGSV